MDIQEFRAKVAEQFLEVDQPKITLGIKFRSLETWDSLTGMAILSIIQDEYGVDIPVDEFTRLETVNELFVYVNSKME